MYWFAGSIIDGNKIELEIDDIALIYGATVFTTVRVYQNSLNHPLTHWEKHLDRLKKTLQKLDWQSFDRKRVIAGAEAILAHFVVLRIAIFSDGRELIRGRNLPENLTVKQEQGIIAWLAEDNLYRRSLAQYKTGNYLGANLALDRARKSGAQEAILTDDQNQWLETSTGNLWGWRDNCWWTPSSQNILSGIVRSHLIEYLDQQCISVRENDWTPDFICGLKTLAYSNSVVELIPIHTVVRTLYLPTKLQFAHYHPELDRLRSAFR
jgi:4-amino-4-deoxychorismate lyase